MTAVADPTRPRLGIRANWRQFSLLLAINAFVGAMVGLERSVLPTLAKAEFGVASATLALAFLVAFGVVKAASNLAAGHLADRVGRKRLLVLGWVAALPVPFLVLFAHSWSWIVAANVLLGINQGLTWSMTVVMKVDLAGPARRGLALGLNESVGYAAVALAAFGSAQLAVGHGPRQVSALLGAVVAVSGLLLSALFARDTAEHVEAEIGATPRARTRTRDVLRRVTWTDRSLSAAAQAGLVNNLNDALAWGLLPIFLASRGLSVGHIGVVAALYPATWAIGQIGFGALSDRVGRKGPIVGGCGFRPPRSPCFPWSPPTRPGWSRLCSWESARRSSTRRCWPWSPMSRIRRGGHPRSGRTGCGGISATRLAGSPWASSPMPPAYGRRSSRWPL